MKGAILIGTTVFGLIGGELGALMDHGNQFGGWAILLGTVGSIAGIWVGYKVAKNYL
jgi:hypothetical protein